MRRVELVLVWLFQLWPRSFGLLNYAYIYCLQKEPEFLITFFGSIHFMMAFVKSCASFQVHQILQRRVLPGLCFRSETPERRPGHPDLVILDGHPDLVILDLDQQIGSSNCHENLRKNRAGEKR